MNPTDESPKSKPRKRKSPKGQAHPVSAVKLREMVDGLATELMISEASPQTATALVATLAEISEAAKTAGLEEVPRLTAEIAGAIENGSDEQILMS